LKWNNSFIKQKYVQLPSTVQIKSVDNDQLADRRRIVNGDDIDDEDKLVDEIIETACRELNECLLESTHMLMVCRWLINYEIW
jgi:hypothetical protein